MPTTSRPRFVALLVLAPMTLGCSTPAQVPQPAPSTEPGRPPVAPPPPSVTAAPAASPVPSPAPGMTSSAAQVVGWWDDRRRRAWVEGDVASLHSLYVPGSRAGDADVDHLAAYVEAGVAVDGWQTQRRGVRELTRRGPVLTALVTTSQRGASARLTRGGRAVRPLPVTAPRRLRVALRWSDSFGWRVGEVRPVSPSAPPGPRAAPAPRRGGRS